MGNRSRGQEGQDHMLHLHSDWPQREWTPPEQALTPAKRQQHKRFGCVIMPQYHTVFTPIHYHSLTQEMPQSLHNQLAHILPDKQQQMPAIPLGGKRWDTEVIA